MSVVRPVFTHGPPGGILKKLRLKYGMREKKAVLQRYWPGGAKIGRKVPKYGPECSGWPITCTQMGGPFQSQSFA